MGTLTGDLPRLDHYCEHKLPASCRLTATPLCCACADLRPHSSTYRIYIDGVGFVNRGNRWQRYCWFCKEFWENRVAASGLPSTQTKIPQEPDQTDFLAKWYEFHQGYRIVKREDGTEQRMPLQFEAWREVSPGHLPRTLQEMREGAVPEMNRRREEQRVQPPREEGPTHSLDDALDLLMEQADRERDAALERQETEEEVTGPQEQSERLAEEAGRAEQQPPEPTSTQEQIHAMVGNLTIMISHMEIFLSELEGHARDLDTRSPSSLASRLRPVLAAFRSLIQRVDDVRNRVRRMVVDRLGQPESFVESLGQDVYLVKEMTTVELNELRMHINAGLNGEDRQDNGEASPASDNNSGGDDLANLRELMNRLRYGGGMLQLQVSRSERIPEAQPEVQPILARRRIPMAPIPPDLQRRIDEANQRVAGARRAKEQAARQLEDAEVELRSAQQQVQSLQRERRTNENYQRVFGTREDMESQGAEYESPIGGLFNRAWGRYAVAEEVRQQERFSGHVQDEQARAAEPATTFTTNERPLPPIRRRLSIASRLNELRRLTDLQRTELAFSASRLESMFSSDNRPSTEAVLPTLETARRNIGRLSDIIGLQRELRESGQDESRNRDLIRRLEASFHSPQRPDLPTQSLDNGNDERPEPLSDEQLMVQSECKICLTQISDTAVLPCGHLVMCSWCANQLMPAHPGDRTRTLVPANCPACRKRVRQRVRIYR